MREWCVAALIASVGMTMGAALWNIPPATDDGNGANIGAGLLLLLGVFCTIISVFAVLASSSASEVAGDGARNDEAKTAWPRPED